MNSVLIFKILQKNSAHSLYLIFLVILGSSIMQIYTLSKRQF